MSVYANHLFEVGTKNNSWAHLYEYINTGDRVLDVGCSTGYFGEALMQLKQCEVWGVDIDKGDIEEAKKRLTKALLIDINNTSNYKELGRYDVIIFADVLEHLIDPRATLENVKELLVPGGRVIFSIPHMAHSSVRLDLLKGRFPYKNRGILDNTHLHFYDLQEAESIFADAAYTIVQIDPVISKYPYALITEKLLEAGIKSTKKTEEYFSETGGDIFQIVGYAKTHKKGTPKQRDMEYIMPQDEMYQYVKTVEAERANLETRLEEVLSSSSWKMTEPLRRVKTYIKKLKT